MADDNLHNETFELDDPNASEEWLGARYGRRSPQPFSRFTRSVNRQILDKLNEDLHERKGVHGPIALRSQDWDSHEVKEWRSYTFVIIGHDSSAGAGSHDGAIDHANRIRQSRAWTRLSKFGVVEMTFGNGSTPQILTNRINALMAGKNSEDLIFFYFRGRSFGTNEEYRWVVPGIQEPVDAFRAMNAVNGTNCDVLWLLDCTTHTRWTPLMKRDHAMTEVIALGTRVLDSNGRTVDHRGEYFRSMIRIMEATLGGPDVSATCGFDTGLHSLPELMSRDRTVVDNVKRVWTKAPQTGSQRPIWRIKFDPVLFWLHNKFVPYGKFIQPKMEFPGPVDPGAHPGDVEMPDWDDQVQLPDEEQPDDEGIEADMDHGTSGQQGSGDEEDDDEGSDLFVNE